jgi:hypothetical protein
MPAQPALSARAVPPDRSPLGWLILLPLACLILAQALLGWTGVIPVLDGTLADPDSYMRLNRVLALHDGGAWFDAREPRVNPPEGHLQHWTRPIDALLLAGAWLLEPVLGFRQGLYVVAVLFSPVALALCLIALGWAAAPLLERDARLFACLALLMQPTVVAYSSLGRADHHALLLLLFILFVGLVLRLLDGGAERGLAFAAGAVAALGVWISPEALVFVAPGLAALGLGWLFGHGSLARHNRNLLASATSCLALALLVERGPDALAGIENDRLSLVHLSLFALLGLFWMVVPFRGDFGRSLYWQQRAARFADHRRLPAHRQSRAAWHWPRIVVRAVLAGAGAAGIAALMLIMFPALQQGPLGEVDPVYQHLRLERIVEIQPLVALDGLSATELGEAANRLIQIVGIALVALPFLLVLVGRPSATQHLWLAVALALAVFLPLAFHQVRWSSYAQIALLLPYSAAVGWGLHRLAGRLPGWSLVLCRPLLILVALFWPLLLGQAFPQQKIVTADQSCPLVDLAPVLAQAGADAGGTVLGMADYGPEILYRTGLGVLSIPNHRPQPGFAATYRILTAAEPARARAELERHRVGWILLCPNPVEREAFGGAMPAGANLYQTLLAGEPPAWLRPVPLPPEVAGEVRLFAVVREPAAIPVEAEALAAPTVAVEPATERASF